MLPNDAHEARTPVRVILVSYNTAKLTVQAIDAVLASRGVQVEVVVIDNASSDRTLATLKRKYSLKLNRQQHRLWQERVSEEPVLDRFPSVQRDRAVVTEILTSTEDDLHVTVLLSKENIGFGRANNLAMASSEEPFVFLLNTDAFVEPDTLATLVSQFQHVPTRSTSVLLRGQNRLDNLGVLAADLKNQDGSGQNQGGALPNLQNVFMWMFFLDDIPGLSQLLSSYQHHDSDMRALRRRALSRVGWVGGTAMMIAQPCLEEIGGFDESIFMYGEDVELCLRATRRHWDVALCTETQIVHLGSASSGSKNALLGELKGLLLIWQKHHSPQEFWVLKQIFRFGLRLRVLVFGILRRYGQQRIYQEALDLVR